MKRYEIAVFGKPGCDKCEVLKKRLARLLADKAYDGFAMKYYSLGTAEGLVRFCQCETLNPQRIPSLMVFDSESGRPLHWRREVAPGEEIETFLALETDYRGDGVIRPAEIREVLDAALQTTEVNA